MNAPAFTHHEILDLAEPFVRAGWRPDMAASDRTTRRLVLRPRGEAGDSASAPQRELWLDQPQAGGAFTLTRRVSLPECPGRMPGLASLVATLEVRGDDPAVLLACVEAVPDARQWHTAPGVESALHHRAEPVPGQPPALLLREAHARVVGLAVHLKMTGVEGYPGELEIARGGAAELPGLPEDLLAVLSPAFGALALLPRGWVGTVRLRGAGERRSRDAEARWHELLDHLQRTLSEPPARFHERHRAARWRFALAATWPWALGLGLLALALFAQRQGAWGESVLALMANAAPPLLMALFFMRREMPRLALPRWPRAPAPQAWVPHPIPEPTEPPR